MRKTISIVVMAIMVLLSFAQVGQATEPEDLQDSVLSYLGQPDFSGEGFWQKLSNTKTEIEIIDIPEGNIYFSISTKDYNIRMLNLICVDSEKIKFGKAEKSKDFAFSQEGQDRIILGNYRYYGANRYLFCLPIDNLKIDLSKKIRYQFGKIVYDISIPELHAFISNESVYGGYLTVLEGIENNIAMIFSNHGAFVAKKGEISLKKLASRITANAVSKESKTQKLLDFVTAEIEYNHAETLASAETLKRPNEILMTKKSDCSGKAILYASLLEQIGVDYRLLYIGEPSIGHISVAVEGDYLNLNHLGFKLGTKRFSIAETTARGFQIGKSVPIIAKVKMRLSSVKYIQRPGENSKVYNVETGEALEFY